MAESRTEARHPLARGLEQRSDGELLRLMLTGQQQALAAAGAAVPQIQAAANLVVAALGSGHRLIYCGAGSSGLIALTDAVELPGTFGIDPKQIGICIAGGTTDLLRLDSAAEDDAAAGRTDIAATNIGHGDCLIAVSASGATPYTLAALHAAKECGASAIAVCCNAEAPMMIAASCAIFLPTPPEIIAGSTRMGAGTVQKVALNMVSTLAAIRLGHSHDGQMINLRIDNAKLHQRAVGVVASLGNCDRSKAEVLLQTAEGSIRLAVLLAHGAESRALALALLVASDNDFARALGRVTERK